MRSEHWLASTGIRLSLIFSALVVTAFALAIAATWVATRTAAESDLRERIRLEIEAITAEYHTEGPAAAVAAIRVRQERPGALEYWLEDRDGRRLAGDLPLMRTAEGWHRIDLPESAAGAEGRREMLLLSTPLGDDLRLSVGDDLARAEAVRDTILHDLLWIGTAVLVLCLGAGIWFTRRTLAQMDALTATLSAVSGGRLEARVPQRQGGRSDDLDQLGHEVNRMLDRIDELVYSLKRVSGDVAHDLRTPLTHVQQRLEEARSAPDDAARVRAIEVAERKVEDILRAFDAILRLGEIEAGAARARFVDVALAGLVERVADAYRPDVEASGDTLRIGRADPGAIRGDPDLLAQALANLIENAMRHTPSGTQITLAVKAEDGRIAVEVSDDGPGIAPEYHADVLQPFRRLDARRAAGGFGLGLSLVAAVARLHRAALEVADAGPGLRVTLRFAA